MDRSELIVNNHTDVTVVFSVKAVETKLVDKEVDSEGGRSKESWKKARLRATPLELKRINI